MKIDFINSKHVSPHRKNCQMDRKVDRRPKIRCRHLFSQPSHINHNINHFQPSFNLKTSIFQKHQEHPNHFQTSKLYTSRQLSIQ